MTTSNFRVIKSGAPTYHTYLGTAPLRFGHSFVSRGRTRPSVRSQDETAVHFPSGAKKIAIALPKNNHFVRETHAPRGYYVFFDESFQSGGSPLSSSKW